MLRERFSVVGSGAMAARFPSGLAALAALLGAIGFAAGFFGPLLMQPTRLRGRC